MITNTDLRRFMGFESMYPNAFLLGMRNRKVHWVSNEKGKNLIRIIRRGKELIVIHRTTYEILDRLDLIYRPYKAVYAWVWNVKRKGNDLIYVKRGDTIAGLQANDLRFAVAYRHLVDTFKLPDHHFIVDPT